MEAASDCLIVELDKKEDALMVVPWVYRDKAPEIKLSSFDIDKVDRMLELHSSQES